MQHVGCHYNTGNPVDFHQMHFSSASAENTTNAPTNVPSTTSVLRSWRKKDATEKQPLSVASSVDSNGQNGPVEPQGPIARVAPHNHYPKPPPQAAVGGGGGGGDVYRYPQHYGDFGVQGQLPTPVKYSEIIEPIHPIGGPIEQSIPSIHHHLQQKPPKEPVKSYLEMCNVPSQQPQQHHQQQQQQNYQSYKQHYNHLPPAGVTNTGGYKQQYHHPYLQQKESQVGGYHPHPVQKDHATAQYLHHGYNKISPPANYPRNYPRETGNEFLANLNKIAPDMAQDIINDPHLRESQFPVNPYYQQQQQQMTSIHHHPQRIYHQRTSPVQHPMMQNYPQRNVPTNYNHQYQQQRVQAPDPYRMYHQRYQMEQVSNISPRQYHHENVIGYPPRISPNYPPCGQLEYAQHYQQRQVPMRQQEFLPPMPTKPYIEAHPEIPEIVPEDVVHPPKSTLKTFLENWREEFSEETEAANEGNPDNKVQLVKAKDNTLYVLDTMEIPSESIPQYLHLQPIEKLPPNIRALAFGRNEETLRQKKPDEPTKKYKDEEIAMSHEDRPACKLLQSMANAKNALLAFDREKIMRTLEEPQQKQICRSLPELITEDVEEIDKNEYSKIVDSIIEDSEEPRPKEPVERKSVIAENPVLHEEERSVTLIEDEKGFVDEERTITKVTNNNVVKCPEDPIDLSHQSEEEEEQEDETAEKDILENEEEEEQEDETEENDILENEEEDEEEGPKHVYTDILSFKDVLHYEHVERNEEQIPSSRRNSQIPEEREEEEEEQLNKEDKENQHFDLEDTVVELRIEESVMEEDAVLEANLRTEASEGRVDSVSSIVCDENEEKIEENCEDDKTHEGEVIEEHRANEEIKEHENEEIKAHEDAKIPCEDEEMKEQQNEEKHCENDEIEEKHCENDEIQGQRNDEIEEMHCENEAVEEHEEEIKEHANYTTKTEHCENDATEENRDNIEEHLAEIEDDAKRAEDATITSEEEIYEEVVDGKIDEIISMDVEKNNNDVNTFKVFSKEERYIKEGASSFVLKVENELLQINVSKEANGEKVIYVTPLTKVKIVARRREEDDRNEEEKKEEDIEDLGKEISGVLEGMIEEVVQNCAEEDRAMKQKHKEEIIAEESGGTEKTVKENGAIRRTRVEGNENMAINEEVTINEYREGETTINECEEEMTIGECREEEVAINEGRKQVKINEFRKEEPPINKCEEDMTIRECREEEVAINEKRKEEDTINEYRGEEATINECEEEMTTSECREEEVAINERRKEEVTINEYRGEEATINECEEEMIISECREEKVAINERRKEEVTINEYRGEEATINECEEEMTISECREEEVTISEFCEKETTMNECEEHMTTSVCHEEVPINEQHKEEFTINELSQEEEEVAINKCNNEEIIVNEYPQEDVTIINNKCEDEIEIAAYRKEDEEVTTGEFPEEEMTIDKRCNEETTVNGYEETTINESHKEEMTSDINPNEEITTSELCEEEMTINRYYEERIAIDKYPEEEIAIDERCEQEINEVTEEEYDEDKIKTEEMNTEKSETSTSEYEQQIKYLIESEEAEVIEEGAKYEDEIAEIGRIGDKISTEELARTLCEDKGEEAMSGYEDRIWTHEDEEEEIAYYANEETIESVNDYDDKIRSEDVKIEDKIVTRVHIEEVNEILIETIEELPLSHEEYEHEEIMEVLDLHSEVIIGNEDANENEIPLEVDIQKDEITNNNYIEDLSCVKNVEEKPDEIEDRLKNDAAPDRGALNEAEKAKIFSSVVVIDKIPVKAIEEESKMIEGLKDRFSPKMITVDSKIKSREKKYKKLISMKKFKRKMEKKENSRDGKLREKPKKNFIKEENGTCSKGAEVAPKTILKKKIDRKWKKDDEVDRHRDTNKGIEANASSVEKDRRVNFDQKRKSDNNVEKAKSPIRIERNISNQRREIQGHLNEIKKEEIRKNPTPLRMPICDTANAAEPKEPFRRPKGILKHYHPKDLRRSKSDDHFDPRLLENYKKRRLSLEEYNNRKRRENKGVAKISVSNEIESDKIETTMVQEVLRSLKIEEEAIEECDGEKVEKETRKEENQVFVKDQLPPVKIGSEEKDQIALIGIGSEEKDQIPSIRIESEEKDRIPLIGIGSEEKDQIPSIRIGSEEKDQFPSFKIKIGSEEKDQFSSFKIIPEDKIQIPTTFQMEKPFIDKSTLEEKINSLEEFLPKICPKETPKRPEEDLSRKLDDFLAENPISYCAQSKSNETLLIGRFLNREILTGEELQRVRHIIQYKRAIQSSRRRSSSEFASVKIDFRDFDMKRETEEKPKVCYNKSISAFLEEESKRNSNQKECQGQREEFSSKNKHSILSIISDVRKPENPPVPVKNIKHSIEDIIGRCDIPKDDVRTPAPPPPPVDVIKPETISKTKAQLKSFQDSPPIPKPPDTKEPPRLSPVISNLSKLTTLLTYYKKGVENGVANENLKRIEEVFSKLSPNLKNLPNLEAISSGEYEVSKPETAEESGDLRLHLRKVPSPPQQCGGPGENRKKKRRFRNLYSGNDSDEDAPRSKEVKMEERKEGDIDYSVYQRKSPAGVPKLVIKRRKSDVRSNPLQPVVRINRMPGIEIMVKRRKRSVVLNQGAFAD